MGLVRLTAQQKRLAAPERSSPAEWWELVREKRRVAQFGPYSRSLRPLTRPSIHPSPVWEVCADATTPTDHLAGHLRSATSTVNGVLHRPKPLAPSARPRAVQVSGALSLGPLISCLLAHPYMPQWRSIVGPSLPSRGTCDGTFLMRQWDCNKNTYSGPFLPCPRRSAPRGSGYIVCRGLTMFQHLYKTAGPLCQNRHFSKQLLPLFKYNSFSALVHNVVHFSSFFRRSRSR